MSRPSGAMLWKRAIGSGLAAGLLLALACRAPNPAYRPGPHAPDGGRETAAESTSERPGEADTDLAPTPPEGASEVPLSPIVLGHWKLDEASGGTASDESRYGHHGTLMNLPDRPDRWVAGQLGNGLAFDKDGVEQGVLIGLTEPLRNLARFTIAAWTRRTELVSNRQMSVLSRRHTGAREVFNLTVESALFKIYVFPEGGGNTIENVVTLADPTRGWIHLAATFDGAEIRLYVDGQPQGTPTAYRGRLVASAEPLYLGTNKNGSEPAQPFYGVLDDVWMLSEALRPDEIPHLMAGRLPPGR